MTSRSELWKADTPIISLWMPWAFWVMLGWKSIETRLHSRFSKLVGKELGIHAALKWDDAAIEAARPYLTLEQLVQSQGFLRIGGAILGTVCVTNFRPLAAEDSPSALIDCGSISRYGLVLAYPKRIEAIPARGRQGVWYWRKP